MARKAKAVSLILVLALFAAMAMGSGSDKASDAEDTAADDAVQATADAGEDVEETATAPAETPAEGNSSGAAYEVGDGRVTVYKNSIGTTWVQIAVPVTNTGEGNLYLESGTMDLEDETGHLVESVQLVSVYPQVLMPGETAWYYEETTLDEEPASALTVVPHVSVETAKVDCIRFDVSDVTLADETYGGMKITGRVENTSSEDQSMVYIVVHLYSGEDEFLGSAFTILTDELKSGDKIGFSATTFSSPDNVILENVGRYEIYAYPYQLQF